MFERFTDSARSIVVQAECEARDLGSDQVGTEHLLLALIESEAAGPGGVLRDAGLTSGVVRAQLRGTASSPSEFSAEDVAALGDLGIDLGEVLSRLEASLGPDALVPPRSRRGRVGFTRGAKKSLQLALREAIRLSSRSIAAEHLLLGLLRSDDATLTTLLADLDVDAYELRRATLRSIDSAA